jgi:HK97 family phage portal protein
MDSSGSTNPNLWPSTFFSRSLFQRFINNTKSNITVTSESAFQLAAYWLAVKAIAEDIAKLPIGVFSVNSNGKKTLIKNNPLQRVLNFGFNGETDSMTGIETLVQWMLTFGNAYAEIQRNALGEIQLTLIHPTRVNVRRDHNGDLVYQVTMNTDIDPKTKKNMQNTETFSANDILHLKGPGNGIVGYSVGELAAESLGISIAAQDFTGAFFGNNLSIGAVLETDKALNAEAKNSIRGFWKKNFGGSKNAAEVAILDRGFKFNRIQMSSTDAELLKTRKFQIEEIARWFRIPPHKLMDLTKSTFNNVEQSDINYTTDTLTPWIRRLEVQLKFKFHRKDNTVIDIDEKGLARGDMASRSAYFKEMFAMGAMSRNEVRFAEGLPEVSGGGTFYIPLNLVPVDEGLKSAQLDNETKEKALEEPEEPQTLPPQPTEEPEPEEEKPKEEENNQLVQGITEQVAISNYLPSMKDSLNRLTRKEQLSFEAAQKKDDQGKIEHINKFYAKFENELKDCVRIHADYICNIQSKEKCSDHDLCNLIKRICDSEKQDNHEKQSDSIIEIVLDEIADMQDAPRLGEIRQDDNGNSHVYTVQGWVEVDVIRK